MTLNSSKGACCNDDVDFEAARVLMRMKYGQEQPIVRSKSVSSNSDSNCDKMVKKQSVLKRKFTKDEVCCATRAKKRMFQDMDCLVGNEKFTEAYREYKQVLRKNGERKKSLCVNSILKYLHDEMKVSISKNKIEKTKIILFEYWKETRMFYSKENLLCRY